MITAVDLIGCIMQYLIIAVFFCFLCEPKKNRLATVLLLDLWMTGVYWLSGYISIQWLVWLYVKGMIQEIAFYMFILLMFCGSWKEKTIRFFDLVISLWIGEAIYMLAIKLLLHIDPLFGLEELDDNSIYCLRLISNVVISSILCIRLLIRDRKQYKKTWFVFGMLFLLFICETAWCYVLYESRIYETMKNPEIFLVLFSLPAVLINYMTLYMWNFLNAAIQRENASLFEKEKGMLQYQSYQAAMENEDKMRIIRHEIANQLQTMEILVKEGKEKQAQEITKAMEMLYESMQQLRFCNNDLINVILANKQKEAFDKEVKLDVQISTLPEELTIADADLSMILNNLLDNAVEGAVRVSNSERTVSVKMAFKSGSLVLGIRNPTDMSDGNFSDKTLKSTKKEKEVHGIGLRLVREIVKKYNGSMSAVVTDGMFVVKIVL